MPANEFPSPCRLTHTWPYKYVKPNALHNIFRFTYHPVFVHKDFPKQTCQAQQACRQAGKQTGSQVERRTEEWENHLMCRRSQSNLFAHQPPTLPHLTPTLCARRVVSSLQWWIATGRSAKTVQSSSHTKPSPLLLLARFIDSILPG